MIPIKHLLVAVLICSSLSVYSQFRLYEKGHDSYAAGKYHDAITSLTEYLTKATRDKAIDIDVFYIRALSYYKLHHYKEAIPDFEETMLRGHANKGNIYWFMAKCYDHLKNDAESINYYNNALRELKDKPDSKAKLLYERSQLHHRAGNLPQAHADLKEAELAHGSNADIKKSLEKIEKETKHENTGSRHADIQSKDASKKTNKDQIKDANVSNPGQAKGEESKTSNKVAVKEEQPLSPLAEMYKNEKRYALVIGNSTYPKKIGALKNPLNDATDIAAELRDSHFEVTLLTDATYGQIRAALMKFKENLERGDPDQTVGLFYYAGHGLQFEDENYLVPLDALVEYDDDIPRYCFPINRMVLANMERANTRMNIVILDACRNNPFPVLTRSVGNGGLGEMKRGKGSFIAYATAPGSVASDGNGRNGLYTQELLRALRKPGLTIEQVFKEVRANVLKLSDNKQNTWDSSNIVGEFHFKY